MAKVNVKLFGVYRIDTHISNLEIEAEKLSDLILKLNDITANEFQKELSFFDATVYINGEHCKRKKKKLNEGDEVWLLSPSSGG